VNEYSQNSERGLFIECIEEVWYLWSGAEANMQPERERERGGGGEKEMGKVIDLFHHAQNGTNLEIFDPCP
jgi:hypothetical protein